MSALNPAFATSLRVEVRQNPKRILLEEVEDLRFAVEHDRHDEVAESIQRTIVTWALAEVAAGRQTTDEIKAALVQCVDISAEGDR